MPLELVVTEAGRAALLNAPHTGTSAVIITHAGLSATALIPDESLSALPGEVVRVSAVGGDVVAEDTIHLTIIDDGPDAYAVRSFALYLADGTMFAVGGQTTPVVEKSAVSAVMIAFDVVFADVDAAALSFGDTNFSVALATVDRAGILELATDAEAAAGMDTERALTPAAARLAVSSWLSPATILTLLKAVDGAGSGLDADTLDGLDSSAFARIIGFVSTASGGYIAFANGFKVVWQRGRSFNGAYNSAVTYPLAFTQWAQPIITRITNSPGSTDFPPWLITPTSLSNTGFVGAVFGNTNASFETYSISYLAVGV